MAEKNSAIGSSFGDFLRDEELYEEVTAHAVKRVLAWQLEQSTREQIVSKLETAGRSGTNR